MAYGSINLTEGSGPKASATDTIGGQEFQRLKVVHGAEGQAIPVVEATPLPTQDTSLWWMLQRIYQMLASPRGYDKSLQRQRGTVVLESGTVTTVTTVTTCSTVTSVSNLAGFGSEQPQIMARAMARASWRANVRACIS
jgi:hypothetical protein